MASWVLARKMFESRLQYSASHAIRTAASILFGMIYVSIWQGIGESNELGSYGREGMAHYVAFNQVILWLGFVNHGLGLEERVRTGQIALDLMRPLHLFRFAASREAGSILYNAAFTAWPLFVVYALALGLPVPGDPARWLWTVLALLGASYMSVCVGYIIGVTALWTVESRWLSLVHYSFTFILSGFLIPLEWMPGWLQAIAHGSPYPAFHSVPARIYLGQAGADELIVPAVWCALLTLAALGATRLVRHRVEVQGG